jgi:hypothetical protein
MNRGRDGLPQRSTTEGDSTLTIGGLHRREICNILGAGGVAVRWMMEK